MHGKRSGAMEVLLLSNLCRCCPANQRINGQERAKRRATLLGPKPKVVRVGLSLSVGSETELAKPQLMVAWEA
ncbi:hypothetical protein EJB05_04559 [Eragrostis curvula]|uniref:Uncharacterized protein n=1 Tax=Eragrostis curvula TaxID=38414 RepID=A0A5J9WA86_9POAL|nr:hypothetical protein EJB05_04559 [Eragrostis curvula]